MTEHELRVTYGLVYQCLQRERKMRERVFAQQPGRLTSKLREIDTAIDALIVMKDELKRHVEESPEQVQLFDEEVLPPRKGGY